ncbi:uncharacterized protein LOC143187249 [Calliopsis andreniformis]|uniref:uncharacterized protein LOC143187249 n=1 Tax=Calliopsis andreniformis TaxID=337506 RepID=UPI003FCDE5D0
MFLFFLFFFFSFRRRAQDETYSGKVSANINTAFDTVLPGIRTLFLKGGLDPLDTKDFHKDLEGFLVQHGSLNLINGWIQGLSNVERAGDVILSYENKVVTLDMMLDLDVAQINYDYSLKYGLIRRQGEFYGRFHDLKVQATISFSMCNYNIVINSLKVISIGKMDIKLEGHLDDPLLNAIINGITVVFRQHVTNIAEEAYRMIFQQLIDRVNEMIPRPDQLQDNYNVLSNIPPTFMSHVR